MLLVQIRSRPFLVTLHAESKWDFVFQPNLKKNTAEIQTLSYKIVKLDNTMINQSQLAFFSLHKQVENTKLERQQTDFLRKYY